MPDDPVRPAVFKSDLSVDAHLQIADECTAVSPSEIPSYTISFDPANTAAMGENRTRIVKWADHFASIEKRDRRIACGVCPPCEAGCWSDCERPKDVRLKEAEAEVARLLESRVHRQHHDVVVAAFERLRAEDAANHLREVATLRAENEHLKAEVEREWQAYKAVAERENGHFAKIHRLEQDLKFASKAAADNAEDARQKAETIWRLEEELKASQVTDAALITALRVIERLRGLRELIGDRGWELLQQVLADEADDGTPQRDNPRETLNTIQKGGG